MWVYFIHSLSVFPDYRADVPFHFFQLDISALQFFSFHQKFMAMITTILSLPPLSMASFVSAENRLVRHWVNYQIFQAFTLESRQPQTSTLSVLAHAVVYRHLQLALTSRSTPPRRHLSRIQLNLHLIFGTYIPITP